MISRGIWLLLCLFALCLFCLPTMEQTTPATSAKREIDANSIQGVYRSDLDEQLILHENGSYIYKIVLSTGTLYQFSGEFYFSEEEDFESGTQIKVIKFKGFASPFDPWREDKMIQRIPATYHFNFDFFGNVRFCNYGGLDGEYVCFSPANGR